MYLRYQLRVLQAAWPGIFLAWEDELHTLSDYFGTDHDLLMLQNHLLKHGKEHPQETITLVMPLIKEHHHQLQQHSLLLGGRLYALKPELFKTIFSYLIHLD